MAPAKSGTDTLLGGLRNSPAGKRLAEEARGFLGAHTDRITGKLGDGVSSATEKLTNLGESGSLPPLGEGAKRLLGGQGPVRSALGAATSGVKDKAKGLVGGKSGGGAEKKAMNIEESIDIGKPVSLVYNQWTQFKEFSRFTKGVESVDQSDPTKTEWRAKVFKSRRTWTANIREQVPDRRIVWTAKGNKGSVNGVVTFHPIADDLTRVLVALEYYPNGVIEKTGNLWRAVGRRVRLDLKNFRRFVMRRDEPTGAWRGEIHKGKVTKKEAPGREESSSSDSPQKKSSSSSPRKSSRAPRKSSSGSPQKSSSSSPRKSSRAPRKSSSGSPQKSSSSSPEKSSSSGPAKKSASRRPAKKTAPAKKSVSSGPAKKSPAKKSASSSRPAKKSTSQRSSGARKSTSQRSSGARKSTSQRTSGARKSTSQRTSSARKSNAQRGSSSAAKKSASSSSSRKRTQPAKRPTARKRTSR